MNNSYISNQFTQIILHFYRQIIRKHNNKTQLITKLHKMLHLVNQQGLITNRETISSSQKSPNNRQFNSSTEKKVSENVPLSALQSGKEWSCEWYLVRAELSKILVYVIMHSLIYTQNLWQFQRIKEEINQKLQKTNLGQIALFKISLQMQKINKLFFRNKQDSWENLLIEILKRLSQQVNALILQSHSLYEVDNADQCQLNVYLKELALKLKIKIHYFQLDCKHIKVNQRYGISQNQYNIGYIGSIDKYTLANRFPVLSEDRAKKMQNLHHFQMNVTELIKQYEQNSVKLNQIQSLKSYVSVESKIKQFINTKK